MVRKVAAVLAGVAVVGLSVAALQAVSARLYPLPEGVEIGTPAFEAFVAGLPVAAWLMVFFSEVLGAFLGGLVAGWIARDRHRAFSAAIAGVAVLGSVMNWASFTHPFWFIAGQLVAYPLALWAVWGVLGRLVPNAREAAAPTG